MYKHIMYSLFVYYYVFASLYYLFYGPNYTPYRYIRTMFFIWWSFYIPLGGILGPCIPRIISKKVFQTMYSNIYISKGILKTILLKNYNPYGISTPRNLQAFPPQKVFLRLKTKKCNIYTLLFQETLANQKN